MTPSPPPPPPSFCFPWGRKFLRGREEVITRSSARVPDRGKKKGWLGEGFHRFGIPRPSFRGKFVFLDSNFTL